MFPARCPRRPPGRPIGAPCDKGLPGEAAHPSQNAWISRWRKSRLELPLTETEAETMEPYYDWEEEFLKGEFSADVKHALSDLPAEYRMAVLLADVEEFTYEEIARIMECPIGTVMSRLNRARRMLFRLILAQRREQIAQETAPLPEQTTRRKP